MNCGRPIADFQPYDGAIRSSQPAITAGPYLPHVRETRETTKPPGQSQGAFRGFLIGFVLHNSPSGSIDNRVDTRSYLYANMIDFVWHKGAPGRIRSPLAGSRPFLSVRGKLALFDAPDKSRGQPNRSLISAQKRGSEPDLGTFVVGVLFDAPDRSPDLPI